jgi:hypothetical protein
MWQPVLDVGEFVFDLAVGKHAGISSGALGIAGAVALAIPPIESLKLREVLLKLFAISEILSPDAFKAVKAPLLDEAKNLLARERRFNIAGAVLLILSFATLFLNSIYCNMVPGECHG